MVAALSEPDELVDDEEDDAGDELVVEGVSFFAGDEHELKVCTNVYRLYLRDSVERKLETPDGARRENVRALHADAKERQRRAAARRAPPAAPAMQREEPKKQESNMRGELSDRVTECHGALAKKHGRPPTIAELFAAVGDDVGKNDQNVRMCAKRLELPLTSMRGNGKATRKSAGGGRNPTKKKADAPKNGANGAAHPEVNGLAVGGSLAIMALQAEKARIESELRAIETVIQRLQR